MNKNAEITQMISRERQRGCHLAQAVEQDLVTLVWPGEIRPYFSFQEELSCQKGAVIPDALRERSLTVYTPFILVWKYAYRGLESVSRA